MVNQETTRTFSARRPPSNSDPAMKIILSAMICGLICLMATAGTITGTVRAEGKTGADDGSTTDGAYANRKYKFAERVDYSAMHDFVVYIEGPVGTNTVSTNVAQ